MIYLDNAATTKMKRAVYEAMAPYQMEYYGNAGSIHKLGKQARDAVELARAQVAAAINASPEEIIFTSGGSEANSLAIHSLDVASQPDTSVYCSLTEHDSMIRAVQDSNTNWDLRLANRIPHDIFWEISSGSRGYDIISLMYVNNELGFENPVYEAGKMKDKYKFIFMTDCVQAFGYKTIDVRDMNCDFMSLSSHKIHGPKGVGALYARKQMQHLLHPLIHGGDNQEFGFRGGTENVAGIVGFGKACSMLNVGRNSEIIKKLRRVFLDSLANTLGGTCNYRINCNDDSSRIVSLTVQGVDAETLVLLASSMGLCISAGSACKSLEQKPNEALLAAGLTERQARSTVRISFSAENTAEEVKAGAEKLGLCVITLLGMTNK